MASLLAVDAVLGEDSDAGQDERGILWTHGDEGMRAVTVVPCTSPSGDFSRGAGPQSTSRSWGAASQSWRWHTKCIAERTRRNLHCVKQVNDSDRQPSSLVCHSV